MRTRMLALFALVGAMMAAGCGGGGKSSPVAPPPTPTANWVERYDAATNVFGFSPDGGSQWYALNLEGWIGDTAADANGHWNAAEKSAPTTWRADTGGIIGVYINTQAAQYAANLNASFSLARTSTIQPLTVNDQWRTWRLAEAGRYKLTLTVAPITSPSSTKTYEFYVDVNSDTLELRRFVAGGNDHPLLVRVEQQWYTSANEAIARDILGPSGKSYDGDFRVTKDDGKTAYEPEVVLSTPESPNPGVWKFRDAGRYIVHCSYTRDGTAYHAHAILKVSGN